MGLGGVVGEHRHPGPGRHHRPVVVHQVQPEGARADGDHEVVGAERLAHGGPLPREMAGELRMVLGEADSPGERLLPHRARQALGDGGQRLPGLALSAPWPTTMAGRRARSIISASSADLGGRRHRGAHRPLRPPGGVLVGLHQPVAHGHDDERRPALADGLVVGARHRAGDVLGAAAGHRPHRVLAGQLLERAAGQKRLVGELAAVLLADEHDQRRPGVAGVGDGVDGVAEAGGGVQVDEHRLVAGEGVAGGHADHGALVQAQDEVDVGGQAGEERDLRRSRIAEDGRHLQPAHDIEDCLSHGPHRRDRSLAVLGR